MSEYEGKKDYKKNIIISVLVIAASLLWLWWVRYPRINGFSKIYCYNTITGKLVGTDTDMHGRSALYLLVEYVICTCLPFCVFLTTVCIPSIAKTLSKTKMYKICAAVACVIAAGFQFYIYPYLTSYVSGGAAAIRSRQEKVYTAYFWVCVIMLIAIMVCGIIRTLRDLQEKNTGKEVVKGISLVTIIVVFSLIQVILLDVVLLFISINNKNLYSSIAAWQSSASNNMVQILEGLIFAPIIEEIAFRGVILKNITRNAPKWLGVVISSAMFSAWHWNNAQTAYTFVMGALAAVIYLITDKIRYTVLFHFLNNLFAALAFNTGKILPKIRFFTEFNNNFRNKGALFYMTWIVITMACLVILLLLANKINNKSDS